VGNEEEKMQKSFKIITIQTLASWDKARPNTAYQTLNPLKPKLV
jgi:hypothetical protein